MMIGKVPSTFYGLSESGWVELFEELLKNLFLLYAPPARHFFCCLMVTPHITS